MPTPTRAIDSAFSKYEFTEIDVRLMEALILNGVTESEIALEYYGVQPPSWKTNLARECNRWARTRIMNAKDKAIADSIQSLKKLVEGYTLTEKEFVVPLNLGIIEEHRMRLMIALKDNRLEDFKTMILGLILTDGGEKVKVKQKEMAPDYRAIELMLKVQSGDIWDIESKRKKIPNIKIVVGIDGKDAGKLMLKEKHIEPDYVVESK
jgi:hypothetical protein